MRSAVLICCCLPLVADLARGDTQPTDDGVAFFEHKVRPVLERRCYECHSHNAKHIQGGFAIDSRAGILKGGETGPAIFAGKPDESLFVQAVRYDGDVQMPPTGKLPADEIALLAEWVRRGVPMPDDGSNVASKKKVDFEAGRRFWSFQPPRRHEPPQVRDKAWVRRPIDAFILAALETKGLKPSPPANPRTFMRRATFDLIGLPPTAEEVNEFVVDTDPHEYERLVDRLLDSPHYGERWARYWLDLARYADKSFSYAGPLGNAWLYRDWVVEALNDDMPYDEFVRRQLAVDLIPDTGSRDIPALGFLGLSPVYFKELKLSPEMIKTIVADEYEERIDAVGRTFLGLSLACARCHDHKFDPVSTEDYYALAGVLASTRLIDRYTIPDKEADVVRKAHKDVDALEAEIKKLTDAKPQPDNAKSKIAELKEQIADTKRKTPQYDVPLAHAVDDAALYVLPDGPNKTKLDYRPGEAIDLQVNIRGNPSKLGPHVPRRFLTVLGGEAHRFSNGSGRLELAEAIVGPGAPLSARVIVNRVWKYHFGRGLVETVSDFGAQGSRPSHPELLDDLTCRFIEHGWSLKWLHREIMLSAAYRQLSGFDAAKFAADPENRLLWRMNRRRLDIEAWRDAMLAVCGTLDEAMGGPSKDLGDINNRRRTVYGTVDRAEPDDMLRLYDFPDPASHSPDRTPTTTALQQLFVLNGPLIEQQADALAKLVVEEEPSNIESQIRLAYRRLFARLPADDELQLAKDYLTDGHRQSPPVPNAWRRYAQALLSTNEFLFVD